MTRLGAAYFDALYERSDDPWSFATSPYERAKYKRSAQLLGPAARVLEVGCSIGELTRLLAAQSECVMGIDVSQRAVELACARLAGISNVRVRRESFPESMPPGPWDAIVCSEVLYYLDAAALLDATRHLKRALASGTRVLLVHWRRPAPSYPIQGDELHDALCERLSRWHQRDERTNDYRMDLLHA